MMPCSPLLGLVWVAQSIYSQAKQLDIWRTLLKWIQFWFYLLTTNGEPKNGLSKALIKIERGRPVIAFKRCLIVNLKNKETQQVAGMNQSKNGSVGDELKIEPVKSWPQLDNSKTKTGFCLLANIFPRKLGKVISSANRKSINWQSIQKKNTLLQSFPRPAWSPKSPRLILTGVRFFYVPERASTFSSSRFQKFCVWEPPKKHLAYCWSVNLG